MMKIHGLFTLDANPEIKTSGYGAEYMILRIAQKRNFGNTTVKDVFTCQVWYKDLIVNYRSRLYAGCKIYIEGNAETFTKEYNGETYYTPTFKITEITQITSVKPKAQVQPQQPQQVQQVQQVQNNTNYRQPYPQSAYPRNNNVQPQQVQPQQVQQPQPQPQPQQQNNNTTDIDISNDDLPF